MGQQKIRNVAVAGVGGGAEGGFPIAEAPIPGSIGKLRAFLYKLTGAVVATMRDADDLLDQGRILGRVEIVDHSRGGALVFGASRR